jgi:hypothetical protein
MGCAGELSTTINAPGVFHAETAVAAGVMVATISWRRLSFYFTSYQLVTIIILTFS